MAYLPSINLLTGSKPQGYNVPGKNFGKPAQIQTESQARSQAVKKKTAPTPAFRQYGDKGYKPSNGIGVGG